MLLHSIIKEYKPRLHYSFYIIQRDYNIIYLVILFFVKYIFLQNLNNLCNTNVFINNTY